MTTTYEPRPTDHPLLQIDTVVMAMRAVMRDACVPYLEKSAAWRMFSVFMRDPATVKQLALDGMVRDFGQPALAVLSIRTDEFGLHVRCAIPDMDENVAGASSTPWEALREAGRSPSTTLTVVGAVTTSHAMAAARKALYEAQAEHASECDDPRCTPFTERMTVTLPMHLLASAMLVPAVGGWFVTEMMQQALKDSQDRGVLPANTVPEQWLTADPRALMPDRWRESYVTAEQLAGEMARDGEGAGFLPVRVR
jgi:hypothetical protein